MGKVSRGRRGGKESAVGTAEPGWPGRRLNRAGCNCRSTHRLRSTISATPLGHGGQQASRQDRRDAV